MPNAQEREMQVYEIYSVIWQMKSFAIPVTPFPQAAEADKQLGNTNANNYLKEP